MFLQKRTLRKRLHKRRIRNVQDAQRTTITRIVRILGSAVTLARPGIIGKHVLE
jgi:hypothetical protein